MATSLYPHAGYTELDEPAPAEGSRIRLMCDYRTEFPLWDEDGQLGSDPSDLRRRLGISDDLLAELAEWQAASSYTRPGRWTRRDQEHHDAEGRRLLGLLRAETAGRFDVQLQL